MSQQEESSVMGSGTPRSTASLLSTLFLSLCYHLSSLLSQSGMHAIFRRRPLTPLRRTGSARCVLRGLDSPHSLVSLSHLTLSSSLFRRTSTNSRLLASAPFKAFSAGLAATSRRSTVCPRLRSLSSATPPRSTRPRTTSALAGEPPLSFVVLPPSRFTSCPYRAQLSDGSRSSGDA